MDDGRRRLMEQLDHLQHAGRPDDLRGRAIGRKKMGDAARDINRGETITMPEMGVTVDDARAISRVPLYAAVTAVRPVETKHCD
jgi:hypothetical protein